MEDFKGSSSLESHFKQVSLLSKEPLPEVFITAVGQSADEVGDVVVLAEFLVGPWVQLGVLSFFGILAFERHLMLKRELVDLLRKLLLISIRIIPTQKPSKPE